MKNNLDIENDDSAVLKEPGKNEQDDDLSATVEEAPMQLNTKAAKLVDYINYSSSQIIESMNSKSKPDKEYSLTNKNCQSDQNTEPIPLKIRKIDKIISGPLSIQKTNGAVDHPAKKAQNVNNGMEMFEINSSDEFNFDFAAD